MQIISLKPPWKSGANQSGKWRFQVFFVTSFFLNLWFPFPDSASTKRQKNTSFFPHTISYLFWIHASFSWNWRSRSFKKHFWMPGADGFNCCQTRSSPRPGALGQKMGRRLGSVWGRWGRCYMVCWFIFTNQSMEEIGRVDFVQFERFQRVSCYPPWCRASWAAIWDERYFPMCFKVVSTNCLTMTPFNSVEIGYRPVTPYGPCGRMAHIYCKFIRILAAGQSLGDSKHPNKIKQDCIMTLY